MYCPDCNRVMEWNKLDLAWICPCGNIYTDDELDEARKEADNPS